MSERFYINCPLQVGPVTLDGPEAHHLAAVSRFRPGDAVCLFNGDGHEYPSRVVAVERRRVELEIVERTTPLRELTSHLEVAAPLPKGDRAQFLVEKLTELGVTKFVPLATARSVVHPREAKLDKLHKHVVEASKQCGRNVLMEVAPLVEWSDYCQEGKLPRRRVLGHAGSTANLAELVDIGRLDGNTVCAVGPEGGFTDDEMQTALAAGWQLINLGPRTLRIETAALALAIAVSLSGSR